LQHLVLQLYLLHELLLLPHEGVVGLLKLDCIQIRMPLVVQRVVVQE